jgi:hypothetical protein
MSTYLPPDVQAGLDAARRLAQRKGNRLHVEADGRTHRVLRAWENGFALDAADAPHLRGLVDLYDGARHLSQCLIVASSEETGEVHFEYKRLTEASGRQPLDFYRSPDAPAALLPRPDANGY